MMTVHRVLNAWDTQLLIAINVHLHHPLVMAWMQRLTWLGGDRVVVGLAAVSGVVAWRRQRRRAIAGIVGVVVALGATIWMKGWIHRPRPAQVLEGLHVIPGAIGFAFPSGHAAGAFALATFLWLLWPRGGVIWWTLAGLVAWSRVYLGVHYPSDCLVGALLGSGIVWGVVRTVTRRKAMTFKQWWAMVVVLMMVLSAVSGVALAAEHGGKEHAGQEHGGSAPAAPAPAAPAAPAAPSASSPVVPAPAAPALKQIEINFSGEVTNIAGEGEKVTEVTVRDTYGVTKQIKVAPETKVQVGTTPATLADVKAGKKVSVKYTYDVGTGMRQAKEITIAEPSAAPAASSPTPASATKP